MLCLVNNPLCPLTWSADWLPGERHVESGLFAQGRGIHTSANEKAGTTAKQHAHHQHQPIRKSTGWSYVINSMINSAGVKMPEQLLMIPR